MLAAAPLAAWAAGLDAISDRDTLAALRTALEKGADAAVGQLGRTGGFSRDPKHRIPLPHALATAEPLLRMAGKGEELDRLVESMNTAAERAVPKARPLLTRAIRSMQVEDARAIITGGDDSVTRYFREKTESALTGEFRPEIAKQVAGLGIARQYDALAGRGARLGLVDSDATSMDGYVTARALDALYGAIAEQERAIRANPLQAGSAILGKVFGALK